MNDRERAFIDTNVLVYADDASAGGKHERALALLGELAASGRAVLSTQVLQEYYVVSTRKLGVSPQIARRKVETLSRLHVVIIVPELILAATDLHARCAISFWDALIVTAAAAGGCRVLLTEDLNDGETIGGVRVENPFGATSARDRGVVYDRTRRAAITPVGRGTRAPADRAGRRSTRR
jgi:predicted nucleic acid-binding protein